MTSPPNPSTERVAQVVGDAIKASGLTVNRVATLSHVPQPTLRQKLAAARPFTADELARIAGVIDTKASVILAIAESDDEPSAA